jgi:hypothetical protein
VKKVSDKLALPHLSLRIVLIILGCLLLPVAWYFCFGPLPLYERGFTIIQDLVDYNKNLDEMVKMDNTDLLQPSYDTYYKKHFASGFFSRFKSRCVGLMVKFGLAKPPPFSYGFLKKLLEENTKFREAQNFKGLHVVKFNIDQDSKIIVVGVLQGALHSFTRDLLKMQDLGLMTKDFKLTNPKTIMFFLGNTINRSPYTSETFMIVLKIMLENPKQIFYMRGGQEFNENWIKYSLRQELDMGAQRFAKGKEGIPLMAQVDGFFNTLPMEAYGLITAKKTAEELSYIVISAHIENKDLIERTNEKNYLYFIRGNETILDLDKVVKKQGDAEEKPLPLLKASIRDIRKRSSYEQMDGLRALPPEGNASAWTVFSSPTASYRIGLKFVYDAFAVVTPAEMDSDWKITLYSRNIENKDFDFKMRQEALFVGGSNEKGIDGKPAEKTQEKKPEKASEKSAEKVVDKVAEKKVEKVTTASEAKPAADNAKPASNLAQASQETVVKKTPEVAPVKPVEPVKSAEAPLIEAKPLAVAEIPVAVDVSSDAQALVVVKDINKKKNASAKAVKENKEVSVEDADESEEESDDVESPPTKPKKVTKTIETRIIEKTKMVQHPGVSKAQLAFYKELVEEVKALKGEIAGVRGTILKELQKFEIPEAGQKTIEQDAKKNDKSLAKQISSVDQEKKQVLDSSATQSSKLEESINQALQELKKHRPEITIYNQLGQQGEAKYLQDKTAAETKALADKGLETVAVMVNTLKEELKQQRMLTQKALAEK